MRTATFALENKFYHFIDSIYSRVFRIKRVRNLNLKTIDEQLRNNLITELNRPTVKKQFDEIINEVYKKAILDAERAIKRAYGVEAEPPLPLTEEAIKITQSLGDDIRASILKMLEENKLYTASIPELARAVKDFYGRQRYRAERFARTFVNTVYNNTHIETYRRSGVVQYVQFTAYLDNRTSYICRMMHGTIVEVEKASVIQPPLHFNCRSRLIPYFGRVREDLLFEERDFTKPVDMKYKRTEEIFDYEKVIEELEKMKGFKTTWAIPNFVLDSDIQRRLLREIGLMVKFESVIEKTKSFIKVEDEVIKKMLRRYEKKMLEEETFILDITEYERLLEKGRLSPEAKDFVKKLIEFNREEAREWYGGQPSPLIEVLEKRNKNDIIEFNRKVAQRLLRKKEIKEITRHETDREIFYDVLRGFKKAIERTEKGKEVKYLTINRFKGRVSCFSESDEEMFNEFDIRYRINVKKVKDDIVLHYQVNGSHFVHEREVTVWIQKTRFHVDEIEVKIDGEWIKFGEILKDESLRKKLLDKYHGLWEVEI